MIGDIVARVIYAFFIVSHERRELMLFNVTASPTAAWMWRQLASAESPLAARRAPTLEPPDPYPLVPPYTLLSGT